MTPLPIQSKTELQKEIETLKEQAKKAESKGNFNTAHHQMLKRLLGETKTQQEK